MIHRKRLSVHLVVLVHMWLGNQLEMVGCLRHELEIEMGYLLQQSSEHREWGQRMALEQVCNGMNIVDYGKLK
jgi:hypothetical protein